MLHERNELGLEPQALRILDTILKERILTHEQIFSLFRKNKDIYKSTTIDKRASVQISKINSVIKNYGMKIVSIRSFGYELIIDKYR
jgi:DNA-binding response OmpR family regulator